MGFAGVRLNKIELNKRVVTIKIVLKSAQPNKPGLAEDYYIQEAGTLGRTPAGALAELARAAILNLLLRAGHISQCLVDWQRRNIVISVCDNLCVL